MATAHISIERLSEERVQEAWPVLLMSRAVLTPDWWQNEARALIRRGGGVLVARAIDGSIHGLATYECVEPPRCRRLLAVERLVTVELNRTQPTRAALRDCLEVMAMEKGCASLVIRGEDRRSRRRFVPTTN
jgi:hypothetical protein